MGGGTSHVKQDAKVKSESDVFGLFISHLLLFPHSQLASVSEDMVVQVWQPPTEADPKVCYIHCHFFAFLHETDSSFRSA